MPMTQPTIRYKSGDIVLIPFPFTDFSTFKQRPALVISSGKFNEKQDDIIIVAITSHVVYPLRENEFFLPTSKQENLGLLGASIVKLGKIVTVDKRLVRKILGKVSAKTMKIIIASIHKIISQN